MKVESIIEELVSMIIMQEKELDKMRMKIERLNQYLDVYEACLESRTQ